MANASRLKSWVRSVTADTIALLIFSLCTGLLTLVYEVLWLGMTVHQWGGIRIFYNILRFLGARLCGKLVNTMRARMLGNSKSRIRKALADGIALSLYQIPIYVLSALIMDASAGQIVAACLLYLGDNMLFGWLFGVILDRVRVRFHIPLK